MPTPICIRAFAISSVSRLFSAPVARLVPVARPASSSARFVIDLLPGGFARPTSGLSTGMMVRDLVEVALMRAAMPPGTGKGKNDLVLRQAQDEVFKTTRPSKSSQSVEPRGLASGVHAP